MKTYPSSAAARAACIRQGPAEWLLPIDGRKPVRLIANDTIFAGFDDKVFEQAVNTAEAPGVEQLIVLSDAHAGYGCPVGSVVVTDGMVYPGPVGPDIGCSMSLLQTDLEDAAVDDKQIRRAIINAICARIPTGTGSRQADKGRKIIAEVLRDIPIHGACQITLGELGIPENWVDRVECAQQGDVERLRVRLGGHDEGLLAKLCQIGSYGGGNHMGELETVSITPGMESIAAHFGLRQGRVGFLSHCGSRGFGFQLAARHFRSLEERFKLWGIPLPGNERELVYAPEDSPEGQAYLLDMCLGANFAVVNHLLINALVLEAIQEVIPGTKGELVHHISHNVGRKEIVDGHSRFVFRKGTTRALPAGHPVLKGTYYQTTGHPILLPGNPQAGSYVMVGQEGAAKSANSVNHGAGRALGRKHAKRTLNQSEVDASFLANDILFNGRIYPIDESPAAYKDFNEVTKSVEEAGLAKRVAHLRARAVIKDSDQSAEGSA